MKKIVANMTMGNDMSPLFPDILNVMQVPVLEIKKMVYLYIINYARTKPDMAVMAISMFIKVWGKKESMATHAPFADMATLDRM